MIPEETTSGAFHINISNPESYQMYEDMEELIPASTSSCFPEAHGQTLMYHLSVLREKVQQVQSLVGVVISPDPIQQEPLAVALAGAGGLIQDIILAASSMLYAFQQAAQLVSVPARHDEVLPHLGDHNTKAAKFEVLSEATGEDLEHVLDVDALYLKSNCSVIDTNSSKCGGNGNKLGKGDKTCSPSSSTCDIIELDAADLLAKYTHYCQICGKGFKRDANLRMHMRAHGDEYKTNAALANPMNRGGGGEASTSTAADEDVVPSSSSTSLGGAPPRKYSCPQEGCRWNRKHAKFQPLKSMICVKNHYKRSHCPKMYVCNRCNRKQFSVLSDLRTHEKHCGDLKWMCSCGTTFSRKDKLMGHVALFVGHAPAINCFSKLQ